MEKAAAAAILEVVRDVLVVARRERAATSADNVRGEDIVDIAVMRRCQGVCIEDLATMARGVASFSQ